MRTTIHKSDREFFGKGKKPKAKSWNLIYRNGGMVENIMSQKPYAICQWKKNELAKTPAYQKDKLKIEPNY